MRARKNYQNRSGAQMGARMAKKTERNNKTKHVLSLLTAERDSHTQHTQENETQERKAEPAAPASVIAEGQSGSAPSVTVVAPDERMQDQLSEMIGEELERALEEELQETGKAVPAPARETEETDAPAAPSFDTTLPSPAAAPALEPASPYASESAEGREEAETEEPEAEKPERKEEKAEEPEAEEPERKEEKAQEPEAEETERKEEKTQEQKIEEPKVEESITDELEAEEQKIEEHRQPEGMEPAQPEEAAVEPEVGEPEAEAKPPRQETGTVSQEPEVKTESAPAADTDPSAETVKDTDYVFFNVMKAVVEDGLDENLRRFDACTCPRCRMDALAIALNRLAPKYVVVDRGAVSALKDVYEKKHMAETLVAMVQACIEVAKNPRH